MGEDGGLGSDSALTGPDADTGDWSAPFAGDTAADASTTTDALAGSADASQSGSGGLSEVGDGIVDWAAGHVEMAAAWEASLEARASAAFHSVLADEQAVQQDFDNMRQTGEVWDDGARRADKGIAEVKEGLGF